MNILLPAIKSILEADARLQAKGAGVINIYVHDPVQIGLGGSKYLLLQPKDFPCIFIDAISEEIEMAEYQGSTKITSPNGIIKTNFKILCTIITNYIGRDGDVALFGNSKIWGIYELADTVKSIFFENKMIQDTSGIIANGQNVLYTGVKKSFTTELESSGFRYGWDVTVSYYRYNDYHGVRVTN